MQNILPATGLDPRTVQPVTCRYTDWTIPTSIYCPGQESVELYLQFSNTPSCADRENFSFVNGNQLEGNEGRHLSEALSLQLSGGTEEEREKCHPWWPVSGIWRSAANLDGDVSVSLYIEIVLIFEPSLRGPLDVLKSFWQRQVTRHAVSVSGHLPLQRHGVRCGRWTERAVCCGRSVHTAGIPHADWPLIQVLFCSCYCHYYYYYYSYYYYYHHH